MFTNKSEHNVEAQVEGSEGDLASGSEFQQLFAIKSMKTLKLRIIYFRYTLCPFYLTD
jgi:hypothetical protein